jgi:hypothetical protein
VIAGADPPVQDGLPWSAREGQALTLAELHALTAACAGPYRDVVPVLALAGLRWANWLVSRSVIGYVCLVLACVLAARCWRAGAAERCTWTR